LSKNAISSIATLHISHAGKIDLPHKSNTNDEYFLEFSDQFLERPNTLQAAFVEPFYENFKDFFLAQIIC